MYMVQPSRIWGLPNQQGFYPDLIWYDSRTFFRSLANVKLFSCEQAKTRETCVFLSGVLLVISKKTGVIYSTGHCCNLNTAIPKRCSMKIRKWKVGELYYALLLTLTAGDEIDGVLRLFYGCFSAILLIYYGYLMALMWGKDREKWCLNCWILGGAKSCGNPNVLGCRWCGEDTLGEFAWRPRHNMKSSDGFSYSPMGNLEKSTSHESTAMSFQQLQHSPIFTKYMDTCLNFSDSCCGLNWLNCAWWLLPHLQQAPGVLGCASNLGAMAKWR